MQYVFNNLCIFSRTEFKDPTQDCEISSQTVNIDWFLKDFIHELVMIYYNKNTFFDQFMLFHSSNYIVSRKNVVLGGI